MQEKEKILEFFKQTSAYTELGLYKSFVRNLTNDVNELCLLQRHQIIHPIAFADKNIRKEKDNYWGDMTKVPIYKLNYEDDILPTAQSILAELLRRDGTYSHTREAKDKVHIICRGQAILLAATLKAKGVPARARSGFASYVSHNGAAGDHWITEYYNKSQDRWILVDADEHDDKTLDFDINDIPGEKFIFGAEAYLGLRNGKYSEKDMYYASEPLTWGLKASLRALFYDFHCLMNDEIIILHIPKYIYEKDFVLTEEEYKELDELANLMLLPSDNFEKLCEIWANKPKYRIMSGALN